MNEHCCEDCIHYSHDYCRKHNWRNAQPCDDFCAKTPEPLSCAICEHSDTHSDAAGKIWWCRHNHNWQSDPRYECESWKERKVSESRCEKLDCEWQRLRKHYCGLPSEWIHCHERIYKEPEPEPAPPTVDELLEQVAEARKKAGLTRTKFEQAKDAHYIANTARLILEAKLREALRGD